MNVIVLLVLLAIRMLNVQILMEVLCVNAIVVLHFNQITLHVQVMSQFMCRGFNLHLPDNDECLMAVIEGRMICNATQICNNTPGSFSCICPLGTELVDGICTRMYYYIEVHVYIIYL